MGKNKKAKIVSIKSRLLLLIVGLASLRHWRNLTPVRSICEVSAEILVRGLQRTQRLNGSEFPFTLTGKLTVALKQFNRCAFSNPSEQNSKLPINITNMKKGINSTRPILLTRFNFICPGDHYPRNDFI